MLEFNDRPLWMFELVVFACDDWSRHAISHFSKDTMYSYSETHFEHMVLLSHSHRGHHKLRTFLARERLWQVASGH